ncbi:potassium uptake protein TrkH [gamma proteobacterium HTCC5015]|nr:potassium uptake protein TrkH [gamma proteobacterium HTCC5015]
MQIKVIQRILGLLLVLFSTTQLPPLAISLFTGDGAHWAFVGAFAITLCTGIVLWFPVQRVRSELRLREGFLVVVLFWSVLSAFASLPLLISEQPQMDAADAFFEAVSGLTTTGSTVIVGLDALPPSILFYRQELQWLGGMGIIVLAVAILPMLGIGGMQLYRAEAPGPVKDSKLTPRINETAKALWYIYFSLTVLCASAYWLAGMSPFDAILHSFSTIATAGMSPHDASIGYFNNAAIEWVCIVFMVLGAVNFSLHFMAANRSSFAPYIRDEEFKVFLIVLLISTLLILAGLLATETATNAELGLRHAAFQVVSAMTTTGFTTTSFASWPSFLPVLLIFISFIGGCAGSTAGGMKVIRFLLLSKQGSRELERLIHPRAHLTIKLGGHKLPEKVIEAVWGFFATYVAVFALIMLLLMATGLDQVTAFSAVAATLNNLGPGLGEVASHFGDVSDTAKWLLSIAMVLGRLEIFTFLVLLTPAFWRR